jgi:hypothetical protein
MKHIIVLALALVLVPNVAVSVCGDLNADGRITAKDWRKLRKVVKGKISANKLKCDDSGGGEQCVLRYPEGRVWNTLLCNSGGDSTASVSINSGQSFNVSTGEYSRYKVITKTSGLVITWRQCGLRLVFDRTIDGSSIKIPPERRLTGFALVHDGLGVILVMEDDGPRAGSPPTQSLEEGHGAIYLLGRLEAGDISELF